MEKTQVSAEQALDMVINWLETVEVKGHANIRAMDQSVELLAKVKAFVHEKETPPEDAPVVDLGVIDAEENN